MTNASKGKTKVKAKVAKKPRLGIKIAGEVNQGMYEYVLETAVAYINTRAEYSGITLYITSDGGSLDFAFAICDILKSLKTSIYTVAIGSCCSAATMIFALGEKRFASKDIFYLLHTGRIGYEGLLVGNTLKDITSLIDVNNTRFKKCLQSEEYTPEFNKLLEDIFDTHKEVIVSCDDLIKYKVVTDVYDDFTLAI